MKRFSRQGKSVRFTEFTPVLAIVAAAFLLRLWLAVGTGIRIGLSVDELQSVVHAYLPVKDLLQSVAMFDPHPPLYYLQLHYWMLIAADDFWLQLNSVTLSILGVISLYAASRITFNPRVALISSLLLAISPFSIATSLEVRMYSLLVLLGIWQWFFTHRFINLNKPLLYGSGTLITSLAVLYVHGAGFLLWMGSVLYGLILIRSETNNKLTRLRNWSVLQLVIFVLYMPWLSKAYSVELGHLLRPGFQDIAYSITQLLLGVKFVLISSNELLYSLSFFVFLIICIVIFNDWRGRRLLFAYVLAPTAMALTISYILKPIWVSRTLAFIPPFLYLGLGLAFSQWMSHYDGVKARLSWILLGLLTAASLAGAVYQNLNYPPWSHLKEPAAFVREEMMPGDIIYVPGDRVYWAWNWYFSGAGSVDPRTTDYELITDNVPILGQSAIDTTFSEGQRYWIIHRQIDDTEPFSSFEGSLSRVIVTEFRNVTVELVEIKTAPSEDSGG